MTPTAQRSRGARAGEGRERPECAPGWGERPECAPTGVDVRPAGPHLTH